MDPKLGAPMIGCEYWQQPFEKINQEDRVAPRLAEDAQRIGCADITAPRPAQIDTAAAPRQKPRRDGAEQIRTKGNQKPGKKHDE